MAEWHFLPTHGAQRSVDDMQRLTASLHAPSHHNAWLRCLRGLPPVVAYGVSRDRFVACCKIGSIVQSKDVKTPEFSKQIDNAALQ